MENVMRVVTYIAALGLVAVAGCSDMGSSGQAGPTPFSNGTRQSYSEPTNCSPADTTCGTGIGNPSVQSPVQKRELNVTP
jgi:hypothetical protein